MSEEIVSEIENLRRVVHELSLRLQGSTQQAPQILVCSDANLPLPDKFSGKGKVSVKSFKSAVELYWSLCSRQFVNSSERVMFIGTLLDGHARRWFDALLENRDENSSLLNDLNLFWKSLSDTFDVEANLPLKAELELLHLQQGDLQIMEFNRRFKQLAASTRMNSFAIAAIYVSGLNADTRQYLYWHENIPEDLDGLISITMRAGEHNRSRRSFKPSSGFALPRSSGSVSDRMVIDSVTSANSMQCNYCHGYGHMKVNCPRLARKAGKASSPTAPIPANAKPANSNSSSSSSSASSGFPTATRH